MEWTGAEGRWRGSREESVLVLRVWCACFFTTGTSRAEARNEAQVVTAEVLFL